MANDKALEDFAGKIEAEGGIIAALEYGLTSEGLKDEKIAEEWDTLKWLFHDLEQKSAEFKQLLSEHGVTLW